MSIMIYAFVAILATSLPDLAHAHGRMIAPPSRMSAFRVGFSTPTNYNDMEMNCGGRGNQWDKNGGKCGICGDPWQGPRNYERPNGIAVQHNVIPQTYQQDEEITITIEITANHWGYMQFRLCDIRDSGGIEASQKCLDDGILYDKNGEDKFVLQSHDSGFYKYKVMLPKGKTCPHCLLQWKWHCNNSPGYGEAQEEFYACADVTIAPRDGQPEPPAKTTPRTKTTQRVTTKRTTTPAPMKTTKRVTTKRTTTPAPLKTTKRLTTRKPKVTPAPTPARTPEPPHVVYTTRYPTHIDYNNNKTSIILNANHKQKLRAEVQFCSIYCTMLACSFSPNCKPMCPHIC